MLHQFDHSFLEYRQCKQLHSIPSFVEAFGRKVYQDFHSNLSIYPFRADGHSSIIGFQMHGSISTIPTQLDASDNQPSFPFPFLVLFRMYL